MKGSVFSNLVSITNGLHRDNKTERAYKLLLQELKEQPKTAKTVFKVNFKRPLNSKKSYYYRLISNTVETELLQLSNSFPEDATAPENAYSYTVLYNKFDKYLKDIANYINKHNISDDLGADNNYIINYLKVATIHLYSELQAQYGQFSDIEKFEITELAEKYFNDTKFDASIFETVKIEKQPSKTINKAKQKISFGYFKEDKDWLLKVLNRLQLSIDLLDAKTDVKDLNGLLLAEDFSAITTKIHLDCKTTDFKYAINHLQPYFKNLTPTLIEKTGLFFTKTGKPLTAQNLYTKSNAPLKKEIIDNIFKQIQ